MRYFSKAMMVASAAFCLNLSAYAQDISLKVNNVTVKEAIELLKKNTGYSFVFSSSDLNTKQHISVSAEKSSIEDVVNQILKGQKDLNYEIQGKKIVIRKATASSSSINSQDKKQIKGNVVDAKGEPIIGATVVVKGTTNGTVTDFDGNFTLNVPEGAQIEVSYIGFKPYNFQAIHGKSIAVTLKEDTEILEEVVVVGYGVQKKVNLSGAVSTVSKETIKNRPVLNVGQALQGAVANMNVSIGSGQATDSPSFNIRGTTSLNGGSPLVVIDGVISDAEQLNRMTPTDIDDISVLKDAASSAIYGSRAAFGVILVTTKKGKSEKLTINYNNSFVARKLTSTPDVITDPYEVARIRNIMSYPWYNLYNQEQLAYAKKRSEDPINTSPYYVNPDGSYTYFGNTDWVNEAYKKAGFSTSHTVDLSGNTDKLNYYFSANYSFQDGMVKHGTDKYNRYNLRSKMDFKITDWWNVGNNTSFITSDYDAPNYLGGSYYWEVNRCNPLDMPYNPDGTWTETGAGLLGRMLDGGRSIDKATTINTLFTTKIDVVKNVFTVNGSFAYTTKKNNSNWHSLPVSYTTGENLPTRYIDEISSASVSNTNTKHLAFDIYASFNKTFNKVHTLSAVAGFNQEEYRYDYTKSSRKELISTQLPSLGLATGDMNVGQSIETWALRGAFARVNYTFDNKYIVEFNGRYDGTSRFPKDSRFAFNPSGSLAWVVSREKFFEPLKNVVSFMKLRGSYGSLGNQDVSAYAYLATMGNGKISQILDGKQPVYVSAPGLVASSLTWEKVTTMNVGMDLNFFDNRLTLSGDYYVRRTKDMLTAGASLPNVLGTGVPEENAADLKTKGWEVTVGWKDQFELGGKPFSYGLNFNLADSRAWITKFANDTGTLSDYYVGKELGEIWGAKTLGFFTSEEDIKNHADQSLVTSYPGTRPLAPGDLKFADLNDDNVIDYGKWTLDDHGDYTVIGNSRARFTFGFMGNAAWNGFDMSFFIQGVGKRDYMPGTGDLYFWGIYSQPWTNITYGNYYDSWSEDNPNAYFPRMKAYVAEVGDKECGVPQTRYLQNAAYARLKNLSIGYTLPKQLTQKVNLERVRVFFSGDNLCEISGLYKYYKVDPEGLGGQSYPLQRSYSFGLNVTF